MNPDETKLLDQALSSLAEHFDYVQIFVGAHRPADESGTLAVFRGLGDMHARRGLVRHWLAQEDEWERLRVCKEFQEKQNEPD